MKLSDEQIADIKGRRSYGRGYSGFDGPMRAMADIDALLSSHEALAQRVKELEMRVRDAAQFIERWDGDGKLLRSLRKALENQS